MNEGAWAILGVIVGSLLGAIASWLIQSRQLKHEVKMYEISNTGKESVKAILLEMLSHKKYTDRSFSALRVRVGGFDDEELRKILHDIGARKTSREDGTQEWWYLLSRDSERIANKAKKLENK